MSEETTNNTTTETTEPTVTVADDSVESVKAPVTDVIEPSTSSTSIATETATATPTPLPSVGTTAAPIKAEKDTDKPILNKRTKAGSVIPIVGAVVAVSVIGISTYIITKNIMKKKAISKMVN